MPSSDAAAGSAAGPVADPSDGTKPLAELLVRNAIVLVAQAGLEQASIRSITANAGGTSANVFHYFGNKDGLLNAAMRQVLTEETAFHAALTHKFQHMPRSFLTVADAIAMYLESRPALTNAAFVLEMAFKSSRSSGIGDLLNQWSAVRTKFFTRILPDWVDPRLGSLLSKYAFMEEAYAFVLNGQPEYRLLLRETARTIIARAFNETATSDAGAISAWLSGQASAFQLELSHDAGSVPERLLATAVSQILTGGLGALTQRSVARNAGVAASMIAYHFGDMDAFVNQSVWHSLLSGMPSQLDPHATSTKRQHTIEDWAASAQGLINPRGNDSEPGFYVGFARTTGQVCLLARRRAELVPLVQHLRAIDGFGTYRLSRTIWPKAFRVHRGDATAFAVWLKGGAVLDDATGQQPNDQLSYLTAAADLLLTKAR